MSFRSLSGLLTVAFLLSWHTVSSWAAQQPPPPPPAQVAAPASNISPLTPLGAGDTVSLHVFGQPDMDSTLGVAEDGTLRVPLAGAVQVAGLSSDLASRRIEKSLKDGGYLLDPHVSVTITTSMSQRVSVFGEVRNPGRYPVDAHTSVVDLLTEAGGVTEVGSDTVYVLRPEPNGEAKRYSVNLKGLNDPRGIAPTQLLRAGDSLIVPKAEQFFILGEVTKPDKYKLEPNMTVMQAISLAGGLTPKGTFRRLEIKRGSDIVKPKLDDLVEPDDVIRVKESIF